MKDLTPSPGWMEWFVANAYPGITEDEIPQWVLDEMHEKQDTLRKEKEKWQQRRKMQQRSQ